MDVTLGKKRTKAPAEDVAGNSAFLKNSGAKMIDVLEDFKKDPRNNLDGEALRLISIAQTKIEDAVLWSVKAVNE